MARALVDTHLDLTGIPQGLTALPIGELGTDGPQLRRDRRRRTIIREVALVPVTAVDPPALTDQDWNWILSYPTRRWPSITARFGDRAALVTADLARAGVVRWIHHVDELLRLGAATGWELTEPSLIKRTQRREAWTDVWSGAATHPTTIVDPRIAAWIDHLAATGRLRRIADPGQTLTDALDVLGALPVAPRSTRQLLAANVLLRSHALDDNTDAGSLVTAALAHLQHRTLSKLSSRGRRALWARVGVETTPLLSRVSALGLRPRAAGPVTAGVGGAAASGIASVLHLTAITAETWDVGVDTIVSVCENPSVVDDAASVLGAACPPLVCVEGEASDAAIALLRSLAANGARLRYHGDFGTGGIKIANRIIAGLGAVPWRFSTADHAVALERLSGRLDDLPRLAGRVPAARWDARLGPAITASGVEIEEELLLDALIGDLTEMPT